MTKAQFCARDWIQISTSKKRQSSCYIDPVFIAQIIRAYIIIIIIIIIIVKEMLFKKKPTGL